MGYRFVSFIIIVYMYHQHLVIYSFENTNFLGKINDDMYDLLTEYPTQKSIWLHRTSTTKYRLVEFFLVIFYHAIPGLLFDFFLTFTKNPRR